MIPKCIGGVLDDVRHPGDESHSPIEGPRIKLARTGFSLGYPKDASVLKGKEKTEAADRRQGVIYV